MFILITGGSGSGKSAFAEETAVSLGEDLLYIATMKPSDAESARRIERHRKLRAGKGFRTAEVYGSLAELTEKADTMLLECVGNLTANLMFSGNYENPYEEIMSGIEGLDCRNLVAVTNEVSSDGVEYDRDTKKYIEVMGTVNAALAERADVVYEVVYGIPIKIRGH